MADGHAVHRHDGRTEPARASLGAVLGPIARRLWDIETEGFERLPDEGPAILCPNHISFLDSAFLMLDVPRSISFVGKAEYMDSWKTKYLFPAMGMIPIDRSGGRKSRAALSRRPRRAAPRRAVRHLPRGHPQPRRRAVQGPHRRRPPGPRDRLPDLSRRHRRAPTDIQPPDAKLPKLFRSCAITIGGPIDPERYAATPRAPPRLPPMIDEVMFEIRELTGQEYATRYAGGGRRGERRSCAPSARPVHVGEVLDRAGESDRAPTTAARRRGELITTTGRRNGRGARRGAS